MLLYYCLACEVEPARYFFKSVATASLKKFRSELDSRTLRELLGIALQATFFDQLKYIFFCNGGLFRFV